ncbi:MAG: L,D-transpeptidase family protein [Clostridiales bacterium]|nr:L,D-transpeptidase family protein [Clostridiales bacterium]
MKLMIIKSRRVLHLLENEKSRFVCPIALGREPLGTKKMEGDGKTPEGIYHICLVKADGKYGRSLGLDYPSAQDAMSAFNEGRIDEQTLEAINLAHAQSRRPPWGTPLGGEIYIHEGGTDSDWTAGCIAVSPSDMDEIYPIWERITQVVIVA